MPKLLSSTARRTEAFRSPLRNGALGTPRAARLGRPPIAQQNCVGAPATRPGVAARQRPQTSIAEATSPCGRPAAATAIAHPGARHP
jgi:hypothetical protein